MPKICPLWFDSDRIVFAAVLRNGVATMPVVYGKYVDDLCVKYILDRDQERDGGDLEYLWFYFKQDLLRAEYDKMRMEVVCGDEE